LKDGKTTALPRYTSSAVNRAIRSEIANVDVYQKIVKAYETEPIIRLYTQEKEQMRQARKVQEDVELAISNGMEILCRDLNWGLAKQLLANFSKRRIQRLSRIFNRMKVVNIVDLLGGVIDGKTGVEACEVVLLALRKMEADEWIQVRITGQEHTSAMETTVEFTEPRMDYAGLAAAQKLTSIMQEGKFWNQVVEMKQKSIRNSEGYLTKVSRAGCGRGVV
jgi:hypothetical protein